MGKRRVRSLCPIKTSELWPIALVVCVKVVGKTHCLTMANWYLVQEKQEKPLLEWSTWCFLQIHEVATGLKDISTDHRFLQPELVFLWDVIVSHPKRHKHDRCSYPLRGISLFLFHTFISYFFDREVVKAKVSWMRGTVVRKRRHLPFPHPSKRVMWDLRGGLLPQNAVTRYLQLPPKKRNVIAALPVAKEEVAFNF